MSADVRSDCGRAVDELVAGARDFGVELDAAQQRSFARYCDLLREVGQHTNLTAIKGASEIMRILFLDSLSLTVPLRHHIGELECANLRVVDIGSGAGIPGMPLKLTYPAWEVTFVESVGKKARFIASVAQDLGLSGVVVEPRRAEDLAREGAYRDAHDVVVARAVAPLATLLELCAPFVRQGGIMLFPKSEGVSQEVREAAGAARALRTGGASIDPVPGTGLLEAGHVIVRYEKLGRTPPAFPRRVGLAKSQPIGAASVEATARPPRGRRGQP